MDVIKDSKRKSFEISAINLVKAINLTIDSELTNGDLVESKIYDISIPESREELGVKVANLKGTVKIDNEGRHMIYVNDGTNCALKAYSQEEPRFTTNIEKCTEEVASNLITNGYQELDSNYNFPSYQFTNNKDFLKKSNNMTIDRSQEFIEIDINKKYYIAAEVKDNGVGARYYVGLTEYDIDKNSIQPQNIMYIQNTLTYLTKDLKGGDTVIHLNDVSNFLNTSTTPTHRLGLIFWNYKDSTAYEYPPLTYSRNVWWDLYLYTGINKINNTITLKEPWNKGLVKSETRVSQSNSGDVYNYSLSIKEIFTTSWKKREAYIYGILNDGIITYDKFRPATRYIKFYSSNNRGDKSNNEVYYKNTIFKEVE